MRKLIDRLLNRNETEEVKSREETAIESLSKISSKVDEVDGGHVFYMEEDVSIESITPVVGNVPWAALTSRGDYLVALPGPVAMATLLMSVNHNNSLCAEINSLMDACEKMRSLENDNSAFSILINEISQIYAISGHRSNGMGNFGFRDEPKGVDSMVYGFLSRKQVVEMAVAVSYMARTKPDFESEGINKLFEATSHYWNDLLGQVGPIGVMETMGSNYEGKA